jgi:hypothetical protein
MFKKVFLAAAATLLIASVVTPVASTPAEALSHCWKASKEAGVKGLKARLAYRKECHAQYKAAKKAAKAAKKG